MTRSRAGFWFWPGWPQLRYAVCLGCAQACLFAVLYGGADWLARQHAYRIRFHLSADLAMPLVPCMAVAYLSMTPLLWLAPFVLRTRRELEAIVIAQATATGLASIVFIAFPAEEVYATPDAGKLGQFANVFHLAHWIALRHNYFPSLHVAFTTICIVVYSTYARPAGKLLLWSWGGAIVTSTLLIHAHYTLDVVFGVALGGVMVSHVYYRWLSLKAIPTPAATQSSPAAHPMPPV